MKKIIILILAIIATVTVNAQQRKQRFEDGIYSQAEKPSEQTSKSMKSNPIYMDEYDLYINGVGIKLRERKDLVGNCNGYFAETIDGGIEAVKAGIRAKMERIEIPECDYEAFKTKNGMYILMKKSEGGYERYTDDTVFMLYEKESNFESDLSWKVSLYQDKQIRLERYRKEAEHKRELASGMGF